MAYVRKCKLKEAAELMRRQRLSESAVAEILGFSSQSHLISCFRKEYGVTPLRYLQQTGNGSLPEQI